ncbi:hypothetical protein PENSPDRAFT_572392 [Peniophora sp. CONT]|nr:hypothetical protein PENSPDRAFT_572392 [Peniophora sp. CONT]
MATLNLLNYDTVSASDADLTLESSDGVLFKVHRINFSVHSCIFPGPEVPVNDEVVKFLESSEVLELLLQFIYPNTSPDLEHLPFEILSDLAEASEKYHIFSAMEICRLHMKEHVKQHPLEILAYASKHGYNPLSDDAAPLTLDMELLKVLTALGPAHFARWVSHINS